MLWKIEKKKLKLYGKKIHGDRVSIFYWNNYDKNMRYFYDESQDTIDCECGVSVSINIEIQDINENLLYNLIWDLEDKVQDFFWEKYKINLQID